MDSAALTVSDVTKYYGRTPVLHDVALKVEPGECFGLVGANGAGKTTLIKCLLDLSRADRGRIELFGVDSRETKARSRLAFLPERFTPPHHLNGWRFLRTMVDMYECGAGNAEIAAVVRSLDLSPGALNKPVRAYSKGMAQKLGLAACLLSGKALLVLDEPMSGLDPKARALVKQALAARKKAGQSLFFSTHLLHDVDSLCDRLAILHGGRVVFSGSPAACRATYHSTDLEKAYLAAINATVVA
ncbi:MAG TPA: ABC transporter ATP-binding protein [Gammaproteobacteria bacterium]|nr:ABC transporter ATP-binding protein [Gammaproteobacteria bacterium]